MMMFTDVKLREKTIEMRLADSDDKLQQVLLSDAEITAWEKLASQGVMPPIIGNCGGCGGCGGCGRCGRCFRCFRCFGCGGCVKCGGCGVASIPDSNVEETEMNFGY
ncbi:hypothetical protein [Nostoc sp. CMAA1605]|uniref:hypothetical protein n=1 Tax=Nostoc sp. CMAA1605 TaxID=2055159 RepID=UPI001F45596D|nr:hypothetical protein [Nostoc sp. CMAA1605]MCF4967241.1 hypothetical protein [Nostoc sp. CMAA1605]